MYKIYPCPGFTYKKIKKKKKKEVFYALYMLDAVYGDKKQPLKGMEFI